MKNKKRFISIVIALVIVLSIPQINPAHAATLSFQLPWQPDTSWVMVGGFSMGDGRDGRPASSPHNWRNGGALDLAPHNDMKIGEDTTKAYVYPIASGNISGKPSKCYVKILHSDKSTTSEYYHLDGINPNTIYDGADVSTTTLLGYIANNKNQATCSGGDWQGPHLHLVVRPQMEGINFSGWILSYDHINDRTSMTKGNDKKYLNQPILNSVQQCNAGCPAKLQVSQALSLSTTSPTVNQNVTATFKVKNVGGQPMTLEILSAGSRRGTDWNGVNTDFPGASNIVLQPGQEYSYQQSRSFDTAGSYFAEPVVKINGNWGGIPGANGEFFRVNFNISSGIDTNKVFQSGISSLWQDQNWGRANLKVCANNLNGNTVYVIFSRSGKEWKYSQKATSNCVTFWDMDGSGPLNRNTTYFSRAALNQWPSMSWPAPNCAGDTSGQGLCDKITRP